MLKRLLEGSVRIDADKWKYIFGKVTSSAHNMARSRELLAQLVKIGYHDNPMSRALIDAQLRATAKDPSNVIRSFSNQHGNFLVRESLLKGPGGSIKLETTWQLLDDGTQVFNTAIPYGTLRIP